MTKLREREPDSPPFWLLHCWRTVMRPWQRFVHLRACGRQQIACAYQIRIPSTEPIKKGPLPSG